MTVQDAYRAALRDMVGPAARAHGFKGSAPTWRRFNAQGDQAVVNVQGSSTSHSAYMRFYVNAALLPEPWVDWVSYLAQAPGMPDLVPVRRKAHYSLGLLEGRIEPLPTPGLLDLGACEFHDPSEAPATVADMLTRLEERCWPVLDRLLDRTQLLAYLAAGARDTDLRRSSRNGHSRVIGEAGVRADDGPSDRLDELIDAIHVEDGPRDG